jgi:hypothetical protein
MSEDKANQISKCILCGDDYRGWGNNPEPVASFDDGQCCNVCNAMRVIPARIQAAGDEQPSMDEDGVGCRNDRDR